MSNKTVNTLAYSIAPATIKGVLDFANQQAKGALDLAEQLETFNGKQLPLLIAKLEGIDPVTDEMWAKHWAEAAKASYIASGRSRQNDPAKLALSMGSAVSLTKVAIIGLTNGKEPLANETLSTYARRMQNVLKGVDKAHPGLIPGVRKAEGLKPAPRPAGTGKQGQAGKASPVGSDPHAAAFMLAGKDAEFASKLEKVASDYRAQFEAWYDKLMAFEVAKAALA